MNSLHIGSAGMDPVDMWAAIDAQYDTLGDIGYGRDGTTIKKAKNRKTGTLVTLKVMPVRHAERRESCQQEAALLSCCMHRNILAYHASFECATEFVLVTEYCPGGDLLDWVNTLGKLSELEARDYFSQLLDAVEYLTSRNITHRDVKLDNVFLAEGNVIKLGDFGFARHFFHGERYTTACGTLVYVAPELLVEQPDYDPIRAEVYSLGITLFALCSAYLPYDSLDESKVIVEIRRGGCIIPSYFSPALTELLRAMLSVNPSERPSLEEIRASEWLSPGDRFARSPSQPTMSRHQVTAPRARSRSLSIPNTSSSRLSLSPPSSSAAEPTESSHHHPDSVLPPVSESNNSVVSSNKRQQQPAKRGWLYRKLVQPIASRISGGGGSSSSSSAVKPEVRIQHIE